MLVLQQHAHPEPPTPIIINTRRIAAKTKICDDSFRETSAVRWGDAPHHCDASYVTKKGRGATSFVVQRTSARRGAHTHKRAAIVGAIKIL